jgi:hypothetical protein
MMEELTFSATVSMGPALKEWAMNDEVSRR